MSLLSKLIKQKEIEEALEAWDDPIEIFNMVSSASFVGSIKVRLQILMMKQSDKQKNNKIATCILVKPMAKADFVRMSPFLANNECTDCDYFRMTVNNPVSMKVGNVVEVTLSKCDIWKTQAVASIKGNILFDSIITNDDNTDETVAVPEAVGEKETGKKQVVNPNHKKKAAVLKTVTKTTSLKKQQWRQFPKKHQEKKKLWHQFLKQWLEKQQVKKQRKQQFLKKLRRQELL